MDPSRRLAWWSAASPIAIAAIGSLSLLVSGVAVIEVGRYLAYWSFLIVWPGRILWRWFAPRCGLRPIGSRFDSWESWVCGAVVGYAIELVAYTIARGVGAPRLWVVAPGLVLLVATLAWWRGRRHHAMRPSSRAEGRSSEWAMVAVVAYLALWFALMVYSRLPLGSGYMSDPDEMFHLALIGELRHHFPATYPYVEYPGSLTYQWFVHAHMAAASWATGLDAELLYRRFEPLVLSGLTVGGFGALAVRLAQNNWAGPIAGAILVMVGSFDVTGTSVGEAAPEDRFLQGGILVHSPTQTLAYVLAVPAVLLSLHLLSRDSRRWTWLGLLVSFSMLSGTKVTFAPMFVCGFVAAALIGWLRFRASPVRALLGGGLAVAVIAVSGVLLYQGNTQSLGFRPLQTTEYAMSALGLAGGGGVGLIVVTASLLSMWLASAAGAVGVFRDPATRWSPQVWWMVGTAVSGYGATFLLGHGGNSQVYFGRSAAPILAALAAWGIIRLFRGAGRRGAWHGVAFAFAAGVSLFSLRLLTETWREPAPVDGEMLDSPVLRLWVNLPAILGVVLCLFVARLIVRDLTHGRLRLSGALIVATITGLGLARTLAVLVGHHPAEPEVTPALRYGRDGRIVVERLAALSGPEDRVVTNVHCGPAWPIPGEECDARHFWMSGLSERRFVLEGWAYTARSGEWTNGFWGDPALLRRNDAFFRSPSEDSLRRLIDRHPAAWIVMDERGVGSAKAVADVSGVEVVLNKGNYWLFEITDY